MDLLQEFVLANPVTQPSVIVLANHLPHNSPIIPALNVSMAAITEFWRYCKALSDALGRQDAKGNVKRWRDGQMALRCSS